jgi:hypothetical protein
MAQRRLNHVKYRNRLNGRMAESYELWRIARMPDVPAARLFNARDAIAGVRAPDGYIWVKSIEIHPPSGDEWEVV